MALTKACLSLCVLGAIALAQPSGTGVISGTVVEASSGDPVRKAVVTATWHGTPRSWATTRTDSSGRFIFESLPPGNYDLRATKTGLGTAIYGADSVRELGDFITLADGETHSGVKLRFLRSGTISGRVFDPDGDPIPGVNVVLLRPGRNLGERTFMNYRNAPTDDRGEYKITMVDPGEYYLRCSVPNRPQATPHNLLVPQYYAGARDSKDASPLILRGEEALTGIDFHLTASHPATITGRVTGVPPLDPPEEVSPSGPVHRRRGDGRGVTVNLTPAGEDQVWWGSNGAGAPGPDYRFEMSELIPGSYRIQASATVKDKTYYASQLVDAQEGANDFVLAMHPAVTVKGRLKIEGPGAQPSQNLTIALSQAGSGPQRESFSSPVAKDGSFSIEQVPPGEWAWNINPNPTGTFEKSVRLGDKDYLFKRIEIPPGSDAPLNIVLSSNTAAIEGQIEAAGADAGKAGILLEPVGKWHTLTRFYYSATGDDNGKFKLSGIAPGRYKIFALEKIATTSYRNPESAELLDALGEELEVTEGAKIQSNPKLIPREKAKEILKP